MADLSRRARLYGSGRDRQRTRFSSSIVCASSARIAPHWLKRDRKIVQKREPRACTGRDGAPILRILPMIWFFRRGSAQVDIEVRRVGETFELVVDYPDGSEDVERFTEPRKLVRRSLRLQRRLIREGWVPSGPDVHAATLRRRDAAVPPVRAAQRLWTRLQKQVSARFAATFGL